MGLVRALGAECPGLVRGYRWLHGAVVALPLGSFEDRGWMPVVLDTLLALEVSCTASRLCGVLVAWPLGYGFSPGHGWSVSLDEDSVAGLAAEVAAALLRRGASRVVVVDGHYGHMEPVRRAVEAAGALYLNVWRVLEELGVRRFREQLGFERLLSLGLGGELVRRVAWRLCSMVGRGGG